MKEHQTRTLIVEAHADDAAWIAGGTIPLLTRRGEQVDSFMATDSNWEGNGTQRYEEQREMMNIFGMKTLYDVGNRFEIPDGSLEMTKSGILLVQALLHVVDTSHDEGAPYDRIITFGPDGWSGHTDHKVVSQVARAVFGMRSSITELWMAGMGHEERASFDKDYEHNSFYENAPHVDTSSYRPVIILDTLDTKIVGTQTHESQLADDGKLQIERIRQLAPIEYFNVYQRT